MRCRLWMLENVRPLFFCTALCAMLVANLTVSADERPPALVIANSDASSAAEMKPYIERIEHVDIPIEMLPIPGGKFVMGSPNNEADRTDDEGPQHEVEVAPFWMAKTELTWDAYEIWMSDLDVLKREVLNLTLTPRDKAADKFQLTYPTKPYTDMSFNMGKLGYPAICMTQHAARTYCKWLSAKTGRYYRLPTEAEWEYACRAGTKTAYSFGDDPAQLGDYGWFTENSNDKYQRVAKKKPNPWGLHDMHGNVAEWVLDQHVVDFYSQPQNASAKNPLAIPRTLYPRVVRGGGWDNEATQCRSASRAGSAEDWSDQDPQEPRSIWYHTDALSVGFRIVRPLIEPSDEEKANKWDKAEPIQRDRDKPKVETKGE